MDYTEFNEAFIQKTFTDGLSVQDVISNEMIPYPLFHRQNVLRRMSDFSKLWDISDLKEYPTGSMLHVLDDNYLMDKPIVLVPDIGGWVMSSNPIKKFVYHECAPADRMWIQDIESFYLPAAGLVPTLTNYRRRYPSIIRVIPDLKSMPAPRIQTSAVINYNPLYRARVLGQLRMHRRVNYMFTNIFNTIAQFPSHYHFIPIPVGSRQFDRSAFIMTFKKLERSVIRFPEDPWYLFCMHLLGFVHGDDSPTLFNKVPQSAWPRIHFVLHTSRKLLILRMDTLRQFNGEHDAILMRLIKLLNSIAESSYVIPDVTVPLEKVVADTEIDTSLPEVNESIPFEDVPSYNVVVTKRQEQPKSETEDDTDDHPLPKTHSVAATSSSPMSVLKTTSQTSTNTNEEKNTVQQKKTTVSLTETKRALTEIEQQLSSTRISSSFSPITIDEKWIEPVVEMENREQNAPEFKEPMAKKEIEAFNRETTKKIDTAASDYIENQPELTSAQRARAEKQSVAYKSIVVGGEKVEDILNNTPNEDVDESTVSCLKDEVADPSMLNSSVNKFETDYMNKLFKRDMLAVLSSFNKVGMFLTNVTATDCSDPLNKSTRYVATYEDVHHKTHTINFVLPDVDERGYCLINGTYYMLKKQRVPLPICKVSNVRVTLNSDYNKYLVERNTTVAHSFIFYIDRIIKASQGSMRAIIGSHFYDDKLLPYEYSTIARKYSRIEFTSYSDEKWILNFDHAKSAAVLKELHVSPDKIKQIAQTQTDTKSVWFGISTNNRYALCKLDGSIIVKDIEDDHTQRTTLIDFLCDELSLDITPLNEWTDFKLLNTVVPVAFALCYRYGLTHMLNYTNCRYRLYDKTERFDRSPSDIVITFADKKLVIPRSPLTHSLLFAGLNNFDLKKINIDDMDTKDIYYDLIQSKKISVHNLKGIDNFFDYFVDPMTEDVLHQMKEPVTAKDLLIRATELLSTEDHKPAASSTNFRFRSYERICSAVYKVLSRAHATYVSKSLGATHKFSISDFEIKQLIAQDQLMENIDFVNPINDIKYQAEYSHSGFGGRQSVDTFMVEDRQFPDDATGIISEATVDSGKTGYIASMTTDPTITNMRGMTVGKPPEELKPTNVLSPTSILVPGVTQDDGKRCNFVNIHLSHYVATKQMDPFRVRTTYEKVVAHRCRPPFAYAAEEDGKIELIDETAKVLKVVYKSGKSVVVNFGDDYTKNGGGGFYCTQNIVINNFKQGDTVKRGDILVYNEKFFTTDPYSKQVEWNMGTIANVACIETNNTLDDGNAISKSLADKLMFNPVHVRDVVITKKTNVHTYANIGTFVLNTDALMVFDQSEMTDDMFGKLEGDAVDLLAKLNRQTPKAKFTGTIVKIDAFFKCPISELSSGIKSIVSKIEKDKLAKYKIAEGTSSEQSFDKTMQVKYTDRIGITDIDDDTVILRFYIQQNMQMDCGSKIECGTSLKSVTSFINPTDWEVEDGSIKIQMLFSQIGMCNRIVNSPFVLGMTSRVMEKVEQDVLKKYFGDR